jgi:signal transduction histidine kinase
MDIAALRDHAAEMLQSIVRDLESQGAKERAEEAKGRTGRQNGASAPAQQHGEGRAERGFTVAEMVAEFRALRATVMRLWAEQQGEIAAADLGDVSRFHEAIDQAIAESVTRYNRELTRSKDRFIAILGHDLRNPLNAITMSASLMLEAGELPDAAIGRINTIVRGARRMDQMVADLLDFARARFGRGIPITRVATDMKTVVDAAVAEVTASHPNARVEVEARGDLHGNWDGIRLAQVVTNLVSNAVQHGTNESPVEVTVRGMHDEVVIAVRNEGPAIAAEKMSEIFDLAAGHGAAKNAAGDHLGLGLSIVAEIVKAHDGSIDARSSAEAGTVFTVRLPRTS